MSKKDLFLPLFETESEAVSNGETRGEITEEPSEQDVKEARVYADPIGAASKLRSIKRFFKDAIEMFWSDFEEVLLKLALPDSVAKVNETIRTKVGDRDLRLSYDEGMRLIQYDFTDLIVSRFPFNEPCRFGDDWVYPPSTEELERVLTENLSICKSDSQKNGLINRIRSLVSEQIDSRNKMIEAALETVKTLGISS